MTEFPDPRAAARAMPISRSVSLRSLGLDETWLQDRIWESPSCLGLGDLEGVTKERAVSSGGRLDLLLKDPVDDTMFEVETMLGETDPDHIVRTIEYWDLIKRKWPQRQHHAVLVAERITKRFFNVIRLLSDAVPLVAIQVNVVESEHGHSLHFTKVLDVYEEPDDETTSDTGTYDEAYWTERSPAALEAARFLHAATAEIYGPTELRLNKNSVVISAGGYNQLAFRKRSGNKVLISFRPGDREEEVRALLERDGLSYSEHAHRFRLQLTPDEVKARRATFEEIARLNNQWWRS